MLATLRSLGAKVIARCDREAEGVTVPAEAEAEFSGERADPMRVRMLFVVGVQTLIWASQAALFESRIFPVPRDAHLFRAAQLAIYVPFVAFLLARPRLRRLEWGGVVAFGAMTIAAAGAITAIYESCIVPFTLTLEWGQMVIVLATQLSFVPALSLLAITWISGALATTIRAHWDVDLSDHAVLLGVYGVLLSAVLSFDRLRRREFVGRHRLEAANRALIRADEVRTRLFVNLSHDFRTPLALIHAEAELLDRDGTVTGRVGLERIREQVAWLANLTNELLELARLEAGRTPRNPANVDVRAIAESVASHFQGVSGPIVQVEPSGEPAGVLADPGHLRRILTNLIANATRHVKEPGGVRIRFARDGASTTIDVEDDGPGISAEHKTVVFERFASFDAAGSVASGIGLPVARELAELNGGTLDLTDAPRTTFRLRLPFADGAPVEVAPALPARFATDAPPPSPVRRGTRSLLVVEDHPDMARLLTALLGERFDVRVAHTSADARRALDEARPEAILCDVLLPDGTGYDVLEHVRARRRFEGVPVLFVSALADAEQRSRGLRAGADDYVAKPFSGEELVERVESAARRVAERRAALDAQRLDFVAELHDGVAAALSRAAMLLAACARSESPKDVAREAEKTVREGLGEVRTILALLDDDARTKSWEASVDELVEEVGSGARAFSLEAEFDTKTDGSVRLLSSVEHHTLVRIAREAVTNAVKHGKPRRVRLLLEACAGHVHLRVEDDGNGLSAAAGRGRGLSIARRRVQSLGGSIVVDRRPEGGTFVDARLPLAHGAPQATAPRDASARVQ